MQVTVIIPARNEAGSLPGLLGNLHEQLPAADCVVVDNGSTDGTAEVARQGGARVVTATTPGYGYACYAGVAASPVADIVVFMDGDGSMLASDVARLVEPIAAGRADVVCGARRVDRELMPWHQRLGNRVIALMLRVIWRVRLQELGPFRAVSGDALRGLDMPGSRFGWPAQMLARASRRKLRILEIPVEYAARTAGTSKVGGSVRGSLRASWDISRTLIAERLRP